MYKRQNKALSDFTPYTPPVESNKKTAPGAATPGAVKSNNEHDNNKDILHQGGNDPQAVLRNNLVSYYLEDVFIKDIDKSVSYTHLDVYKRQH